MMIDELMIQVASASESSVLTARLMFGVPA
jgi:hypothetical protein